MRRPSVRTVLRYSAYQCAFSGIGLARWMHASFGETSFDQVMWHLRFTERAAFHMSRIFLTEVAAEVFVFPILFALLATLVHTALAERLGHRRRKALRALPVTATAAAVTMLLMQFSLFSYAAAQFEPDRFAQAYVDPKQVVLTATTPRNLVLIYMESMEQTYADAGLFGRNLLAPLQRLHGRSYASYHPAEGATWTMAGMVATQCGVPLKVYVEDDVRHQEQGKSFLAGATCLGDVLAAHGYRNVFLGGAPLSFAGKGAFLRDHGYGEAYGRDEWQRQGIAADEQNEWGLYDSALYQRAQRKLVELHEGGQPFNLTLLTLDTHNPRGFYSPACRRHGAVAFDGLVHCAAEMAAQFVEFARERGYLKDTTIVIVGDHLAMPNPLWTQLQQAGDRRRMFNLVVADPLPAKNREELLPFDIFPTLVQMLGFDLQGGRLGLGYSAVGTGGLPPPKHRVENWSRLALRASASYDRLWEQPAGRGQ